jgi:two-component system, OmpR family, alkaline phosphatase synthesis response regulator PhoP
MSETPCGRVLVVDDDPDTVTTIVMRLEQDGHRCTGVTSGGEALRLCQTQKFDCMVLDAQLGTSAGLAVAERLAASPMRPQHIVIVTGHPRNDFEAPLRTGLIDGYLQKPLDVDDLAERVRRALQPRGKRF